MSLLASLIAFQLTPVALEVPAPAEEEASDIVVLGQKLALVRWTFRVDTSGILRECEITRSSQDTQLDELSCAATKACAKPAGVETRQDFFTCINNRRQAMLARLVDERAEAEGRE